MNDGMRNESEGKLFVQRRFNAEKRKRDELLVLNETNFPFQRKKEQ